MVDLNTWQKVGERLHGCYMAKGLDGMTILTFGLWSQIRDCLDSTPSSVSEPGDEVSFSMVLTALSGGNQTLLSGMDSITCSTAPSLGDKGPAFKYHKHKTENSDTGSDSSSEGEEYEDAMAHQLKDILHLGNRPQPPRPESHGSPLEKALLQTQMHGEDMAGFHVYSEVEKPYPNDPHTFIRVHEQVSFKTLKKLKQACTMYGPTALFNAQLYRAQWGTQPCLLRIGWGLLRLFQHRGIFIVKN
jgi:hypothetical protein